MKKIILIIIIVLLTSIQVSAFNIKFENTTDKTLVYELLWLDVVWVDGELQRPPLIESKAMGELSPGKSNTLIYNHPPGSYVIIWKNLSSSNEVFNETYLLQIDKDKCIVISTPNKEPVIL